MTSGMCTCGGMVGWKGAMPKSSHHRGLARCQEKGKKEWSAGARATRSIKHTKLQWRRVIHKVSGGVHLNVGVLRLPHRVGAHGFDELVKGGRLRGQMQKFKGGELAAEFPPQMCGPGHPRKIRVAGGAAHVDVDHIGGGVEGWCPAHNIIHPQCPRLVGRLLQLMVGDWEGLVVGQGVGSGIGARLQGRRARTESAGTWSKENAKKGFERCEKAKQWKLGQIRTRFVQISHSRESVNLA